MENYKEKVIGVFCNHFKELDWKYQEFSESHGYTAPILNGIKVRVLEKIIDQPCCPYEKTYKIVFIPSNDNNDNTVITSTLKFKPIDVIYKEIGECIEEKKEDEQFKDIFEALSSKLRIK